MRLIDADALMERYNLKDATKYGNRNVEQQNHSYSTMMLYEVADMIEDAPTIEAVPVHGEWETCRDPKINATRVRCSVCHTEGVLEDNMLVDLNAKITLHNFCPNCGAKMKVV